MTSNRPKLLIGASIPRSGHHFLQHLLTQYYNREMYYCEFYHPADCCKSIPCTKRGDFSIIYQKNHDRQFAVPQDVEDALYVVQYRHPVPEALSDRELDLKDAIGRRSISYRLTKEYYLSWLAQKAIYYRKFHDKWISNKVPNAVYLDYDTLSNDPGAALAAIVKWASGTVDEARLAGVIRDNQSTRVSAGPETAFRPRVIEESPHFHPEMLGAFEAYILARCPGFQFSPLLSGRFEDHPLSGLILLYDQTEPLPNGGDRLAAASRIAASQPDIQFRLSQNELREGQTDRAIASVERLLEMHPFFAPAYRLLFTASKKAQRSVPLSHLNGNALLACADSPDMLSQYGAACLSQGLIVNALAALSLATTIAPDSHRAHHLLASALVKEKRWDQARFHAERALALEPQNKVSTALVTKIRRRTN
jgi:tetratricopeptide (TPR) repeat protein